MSCLPMEFTITLNYISDSFLPFPDFLLKNCNVLKTLFAKSKKPSKKEIHLQCTCIDAKVCKTLQKEMQQKYFTIPIKGGEVYMELDKIMYLEANGHYTNIFLKDGTKELSTKNIGYFKINLPQNDFRCCHKSYIINLIHVSNHHIGRSGYFVMANKKTIPFANRRKKEFTDIIGL